MALAAVAIWGTNFVVIKIALGHLPPLLLAALRFLFALLPAVFLLSRPAVAWSNLAAYGLLMGVGQFGLMFVAMKSDISPGLASLVIQTQVFFTIGLSIALTGERVRGFQWVALALAIGGIVLIGTRSDGSATLLGLAMVLLAALCWAGGNLMAKRAGQVNMLAYVVWSSMFAVVPLFALSWWFEGGEAIVSGLRSADAATWAAVFWQSAGNTLFSSAVWGWLLARHPAATVSPMALLVPVFGMAASAAWLGESLPAWKLAACAMVLGGLALNLLVPAGAAALGARNA